MKSRDCFFKFTGTHCSQWMCLATIVAHFCVCNFKDQKQQSEIRTQIPIICKVLYFWLLWFPELLLLAWLPAMGLGLGPGSHYPTNTYYQLKLTSVYRPRLPPGSRCFWIDSRVTKQIHQTDPQRTIVVKVEKWISGDSYPTIFPDVSPPLSIFILCPEIVSIKSG